ncbi:MAG: hypothetical protein H6835_04505 [Planctomycetes bacterium]|nr:hypothetical protein [Planctomycetota bacterium]
MGTFFEEVGDDALVWTPLPRARGDRMLETGVRDLGAPPIGDDELALYDRRGAAKRAAWRAGIDGVAGLQLPKMFFERTVVREEGAGLERRWRIDAAVWHELREPLLRFLWLDIVEPETGPREEYATTEHFRRARGLQNPGVVETAMLVDADVADVVRCAAPLAHEVIHPLLGNTLPVHRGDHLVVRFAGHRWTHVLAGDFGARLDHEALQQALGARALFVGVSDQSGTTWLQEVAANGQVTAWSSWGEADECDADAELDRRLRELDAWWHTCLGPLLLTDEIPFDDRDFGELFTFPIRPTWNGVPLPIVDAALLRIRAT